MRHHAVAFIYLSLVAALCYWFVSRGVVGLAVIAAVTAAFGLVLAYGRNLRFMKRFGEFVVMAYAALGTFAVLAMVLGDLTVRYVGEDGTFRIADLSLVFGPELGMLIILVAAIFVVSLLLLFIPGVLFRALDSKRDAAHS